MSKHRSIKNATLTEADIPGLRRRLRTKQSTVAQEADRFDVGIETIRRAARGETFRHVKDFLPEPLIPGETPEIATGSPLPTPESLFEEATESLRRVKLAQRVSDPGADAVDEFLAARKDPK